MHTYTKMIITISKENRYVNLLNNNSQIFGKANILKEQMHRHFWTKFQDSGHSGP